LDVTSQLKDSLARFGKQHIDEDFDLALKISILKHFGASKHVDPLEVKLLIVV